MAMAAAQQLSSLGVARSGSVQVAGTSGSGSGRATSTRLPAVECATHPQKKATAHHNKTRPKKHNPYDKNRKGPTIHPPLGKAPPIFAVDTGDASLLPAHGDDVNADTIPV